MSDIDYDTDDFDINYDDPGETSSRHEDAVESMNISPLGIIEVSDNENNTGQDSQTDADVYESDPETEEDDGLVLPQRKQKEVAPVWTVATKTKEGAKCNICGKIYTMPQGNTSNIMAHMKLKHGRIPSVKNMIEACKNKKKRGLAKKKESESKKMRNQRTQPTITNFARNRGVIDPLKEKKLDQALLKMTVGMNLPFSIVENHYFRNLLFTAEPNYITPSRRKHTLNFDKEALAVHESLKKEVVKDVTEAGHKTISITSDHGTSSDQLRTKKNALTVARCTNDFVIKKDVVKLIKCVGSQTGLAIRKDVKNSLVERIGYEEDWFTNWVTDNESKQINARDPNKHHEVGFPINYVGGCVDHTIELAIEESISQCTQMKEAVHKIRSFINRMKDSSQDREKFHQILKDAGVEQLTIIQGTTNRWFYKYAEAERALILKDHINTFLEDYEGDSLDQFDHDEWKLILIYQNSCKTLVKAAKILEGELYPTASSVIPFLDTVFNELSLMKRRLAEDRTGGKMFVEKLSDNLKSYRRFPEGFKTKAPYNVLTLLDPRYADLYFTVDELELAVDNLCGSNVYRNMPDATDNITDEDAGANMQVEVENNNEEFDSFATRRRMLLAARREDPAPNVPTQANRSLKEKIQAELESFLKYRGCLEIKDNPCNWWRINHSKFPLLAQFFKAHCAFPATSTSSERVFSMDGLVLVPKRQRLDVDRTENLIICRDYWMSRSEEESYKLCEKCPQPPSKEARYKISCAKHQNPKS